MEEEKTVIAKILSINGARTFLLDFIEEEIKEGSALPWKFHYGGENIVVDANYRTILSTYHDSEDLNILLLAAEKIGAGKKAEACTLLENTEKEIIISVVEMVLLSTAIVHQPPWRAVGNSILNSLDMRVFIHISNATRVVITMNKLHKITEKENSTISNDIWEENE